MSSSGCPDDLVRAVQAAGVTDPRLVAAFRSTPRSAFVPPEHAGGAYLDQPIPIPHGQVTTQPSLSAAMIQSLGLAGRELVLEIGTGYGFQTALLARLAWRVVSVERWADLADAARSNLAAQDVGNVVVLVGDGTRGEPRYAPYDAVLVSAALAEVPHPLVEQLRVGGRLVQPIGVGGDELVTLFERRPDGLAERSVVTRAHFVRLYGEHGYR